MNSSQKLLIISFHDLHPGSWDCCRRFIEKSRQLGARSMSLLVIPQYHGQEPFTENKNFVAWLQSLPPEEFDFCLHGYNHLAREVRGNWFQRFMGNVYTTGEGEFYQLTREESQEKLTKGLSLFTKNKLPVYGFTAPAWLLGEAAKIAIRESGFLYNTLWDRVELPATNVKIMAPTLVYSSRNAWRRQVSRLWISFFHHYNRNKHILRLAVHPIDLEHPTIENHLYKTLEKALRTRTTATYRDLVPGDVLKPASMGAND